ncbi:hypothetical protein [Gemmata sp.]|uniref:hypothetical protein n=1 Tax=Gemmata sp. TaxID=1914242 RepID=UPI003F6F63B8
MPEPETEVVLCPACKHALRVPLDWLGTSVQCPECKATFRAPARDGSGGLTDAVLLSRPNAHRPAARKPLDAMLLLPAFGLMLLGTAGVIVNAGTAYQLFADPPAVAKALQNQLSEMRKFGVGQDDPEADRDRLDAERAAKLVRGLLWGLPVFAVVSGVAFLGGLSIATRWNHRVAQLGCLAASLNVPHLCCVPGAVVGLWALLMLSSDEGRAHFEK